MVALRLGSGLEVGEGDKVGEAAPWAAALSDRLLSSHCAACFRPCPPTSLFPCPGPCQGALVFCSTSCMTLDLPLHFRSAECNLLRLLRSSASPVSASSAFPSLGGSCDIRAALRLLALHRSLHHVGPFLAAFERDRGVCGPRLGGLLSNRSVLLQTGCSRKSEDEEELQLAAELQEAAALMYRVLYSLNRIPHVWQCDIQDDLNQAIRAGQWVTEHRDHSAFCGAVERQIEISHTGGSSKLADMRQLEDSCPHKHKFIKGAEFAKLMEVHEGIDDNHRTDMDLFGGIAPLTSKNEEVLDEEPTSLSHFQKMLLLQEVLCQVFTNGVQIHTDTWSSDGPLNVQLKELGTAVYSPSFSWINHSCKPNTFFSFALLGKDTISDSICNSLLHPDIYVMEMKDTWGLRSSFPWCERAADQGSDSFQYYGPRVQLRAIRTIKEDEPVYVSYIDLIQPKGIRRWNLWLKYRFHCNCERCKVESTDNVDSILEKLGPDGSQSGMAILEEWLQDKSEHGLRELLENNNPLSCCEILEGAMTELVHQSYHFHFNVESSKSWPVQNSNYEQNQGLEASSKQQRHLKLHLIHHLCLDIYVALTSSYKILAFGFIDSSDKCPSTCDAASCSDRALKIREVECSMASAAYSLFLAMMVQHLCDLDEPGLMAISSRFWLQNWEALIFLISKLDSFFHIDSMSGMEDLLSICRSEFDSVIFSQDNNFVCKFKELLLPCQSLQNCVSNKQLLQCTTMALWPFLRSTSPFLSKVEIPFGGSNEVFISPSKKQADLLKSKVNWLHYRGEALICAFCSLRHSVKLMNVIHGNDIRLIEAMRRFFGSCFGRQRFESSSLSA